VSFKQREAKRKKKVAVGAKRIASRKSGGSSFWWLTPVRKTTCCSRTDCGRVLRAGKDEMVFRKLPEDVLCVLCADHPGRGVSYRPSTRWEQQRRKGKAS